jgi:tRNA 2-thiouridine synthesizing protein A
MSMSEAVTVIDALGKPCPMPLLMLKRALKTQAHGQWLLKSSDPHSQVDIGRYCQIHAIACEIIKISAQEFHYRIES